jgi:SAM-dependent methyltransferase
VSWPNSYFELIVARSLIEHVPDPPDTLWEVHRVLAPGGVAVLVTPNADSLEARPARILVRLFAATAGVTGVPNSIPRAIFFILSRATLHRALSSAGFGRVDVAAKVDPWTLPDSVDLFCRAQAPASVREALCPTVRGRRQRTAGSPDPPRLSPRIPRSSSDEGAN